MTACERKRNAAKEKTSLEAGDWRGTSLGGPYARHDKSDGKGK
jgi:hypothetical protein